MRQYYVDDRGLRWVFDSKGKAENKAKETGGKVESRVFWRYYAPYYTAGTSNYREITGIDLFGAIESNFNQIIKDYNMSGVAGYRLNSAELKRTDNGAELVIDLNKYGKLEQLGERASERIQIEGVEPEDMNEETLKFW